MFSVFCEEISQVGHRQHGRLRVLHGCAAVTAVINIISKKKKKAFVSPLESTKFISNILITAFRDSHLFSAVFSIACILSSMVDLIKNLWTKVGLADTDRKQLLKVKAKG